MRQHQLLTCNISPQLPTLGRQGRETEVPRSNDLEGNSPDLIIHILALNIINIP